MAKKKSKPYSVKGRIKEGVCRIAEHGKGCNEFAHIRGICNGHYYRLKKQGILNDYALPSTKEDTNKREITINENAKPTECRIKEHRVPCSRESSIRGLCKIHYNNLRNNGTVDTYALPSRTSKDIKANKNPAPKMCRIIEGGTQCNRTIYSSWLCAQHYRRPSCKQFRLIKS